MLNPGQRIARRNKVEKSIFLYWAHTTGDRGPTMHPAAQEKNDTSWGTAPVSCNF